MLRKALKPILNQKNIKIAAKLLDFRPQLNVYQSRSLFLGLHHRAQLFISHENTYAYQIIQKTSPIPVLKETTSENNEIRTLNDFNKALNKNFRSSPPTEILAVFYNAKYFANLNNITLTDVRFDELINGVIDQCDNFTDDQILELLNVLVDYPQCEGAKSHNFYDLWKCLDDIISFRSAKYSWNVEKSMPFADSFYRLNLGKMCNFVYYFIDKNAKKADKLTKNQLVRIFFLMNVCRTCPVAFQYEEAVYKNMENLTLDEMAIIGMAFFKTKSKVKMQQILQKMIDLIVANKETINEISLAALLKIIRLSKNSKLEDEVQNMLNLIYNQMDRLSDVCNLHIALIGTGYQSINAKTLKKATQRIVEKINQPEIIRLKEIERILLANAMFDFDPKTTPDLYQTSLKELENTYNTTRQYEVILHPRSLPACLNYLAIRNLYSFELMNKIMDNDYICDVFGRGSRDIPRELFILDSSIDIDCPEYSGNRLLVNKKYKLAKWMLEYIPELEQHKKLSQFERLFLDTVDHVKMLLGDEKLLKIDHVMPHFHRADIILCKNTTTNKFIEPLGFENYVLGDVKKPPEGGQHLKWYAIVILGWNNTIRNSSLPLGIINMKERQLKKIGYHPVFIIWNQFIPLSSDEKIQYISKQMQ